MSDIDFQSAHALAKAIRRREVSSRELLDHHLARVDRLNPALNAVAVSYTHLTLPTNREV